MTTSLNFSGQLEPSLALVIALGATIVIFLVYRLETSSLHPAIRWTLPTLRSAAVLMMVFLLAGPILQTSRRTGTLGDVTFLIDRSASMNRADGELKSTRVERAYSLLEGEQGLIKALRQTHDVAVIESAANEPNTDLANLISGGFNESPSMAKVNAPIKSLVLISDGRNNRGDSPLETIESRIVAQNTLSTWGFGTDEEPDLIAITDIQHPDRLSSTSNLRGKIHYSATKDLASQEIVIKDESGEILWQTTVDFDKNSNDKLQTEIQFDIPIETLVESAADSDGALTKNAVKLNLIAEFVSNESNERDRDLPAEIGSRYRSRRFSVLAVRADYKLLIVDGRSRWETRYLKNLFQRDPRWTTDTVILSNEASIVSANSTKQLNPSNPDLPQTLEQMLDYDLICIGEVDVELRESSWLQWLTEYVDRGGGLILIDGQRGLIKKNFEKDLMHLVPIRWLGEPQPFFADGLGLTSAGESTEWLSLGATAEQSADIWQRLPPPRAIRLVEAADDAETLVQANLGGQKYPLVVTRSYGGGRIVYLASDETWRWRYKVADELHARFWNQMALTLQQPPLSIGNEFAELDVDKAEYIVGQRATVRVRLRNPDGSYNEAANVEAELIKDGKQIDSFLLKADGRLPGMYVGQSNSLAEGDYNVRFSAAGYGDRVADLEQTISVVQPLSGELLQISQDDEFLETLATVGNGKYFRETQLDAVRDYLLPRTAGRIEVERLSLWDSYYWFFPVVGLLAAEWWLRKRVGLP